MLKQIFLPLKKNNYCPYILRPIGTIGLLIAVLLIPLFYNIVTAHTFKLIDYASDITTADIISLSNQQRQANGIGTLTENAQLDQAAAAKAADMFAEDYWAEDSPSGQTPWDFISAAGYKYSAAAENLAMDFSTSSGVIAGWMGSPDHRTNLLNSTYIDTGVAVENGTLQGQQTTLVVAMYAAPATQPASPAVSSSAPSSSTPTASSNQTAQSSSSTPASSATPTTTPIASGASNRTRTTSASSTKTSPVNTTVTTPTNKNDSLSLVSKIESYHSLNWGQRATLFLLLTFLLASLLRHTLVWRKQKRGWKHIWLRAHPTFQTSLLLLALVSVITSGFGVIK